MSGALNGPTDAVLEHDALFYADEEMFVDAAAPFLADGIAAGDGMVAVTTQTNITRLRAALGDDASSVRFVDADDWYMRPAATVAGYDRVLRQMHDAGVPLVRVIGEVRFGATPAQGQAWTRYEAALNHVFADRAAWIVCPYDVRALPEDLIENARRTHPTVWDEHGRRASDDYVRPSSLIAELSDGVAGFGDPIARYTLDGDLGAARRALAEAFRRHLRPDRLRDTLTAVNEILANALRHGGGKAEVVVWNAHDSVVCEVRDEGPGLSDPVAGYAPPAVDDIVVGGYGLWIARQLSDDLTIGGGPRGTTIRLRFDGLGTVGSAPE